MLEQLRQRPHEDVVAPVWLEVTVDKGDDLVGLGQSEVLVIALIQRELDLWVGRYRLRVDPVVHYRDLRSERLGEGTGLPVRGRNPRVRHLEVQQVVEVLEPQSAGVACVLGRELRVKAQIGPLQVVEELAVDTQLGLGPDFLEKQALAPAVVGDDHIGGEVPLLHLQGRFEASFAPDRLGLEVRDPRVNIRRGAPGGGVLNQFDPLPIRSGDLLHGHGYYGVALLGQSRSQKLELAGEVLVDEKDVHEHTFSTPSFTSQTRVRKTKG